MLATNFLVIQLKHSNLFLFIIVSALLSLCFAKTATARIKEFALDEKVSEKFELIVDGLHIDPYENPHEFSIIAGDKLEKLLTEEIKNEIKYMNTKNGADLIIIHNFPIDSFVPETPKDSKRPPYKPFDGSKKSLTHKNAKGFVSEASILGIGYILGAEPFYMKQEKDGTVINQIIPIKDSKYENQLSSYGSKFELLPHTENVCQIPPLKFFSLLCLRGDPKVATNLIFFEDIIAYISNYYPAKLELLLKIMNKPLFIMSSGPGHENSKSQAVLPITENTTNGDTIFRLNLNPGRTVGTTPEAEEAIVFLNTIITYKKFRETNYKKIYLNSGDFILFKNWRVMHSRDGFLIDPENWRWLQRCYFQMK